MDESEGKNNEDQPGPSGLSRKRTRSSSSSSSSTSSSSSSSSNTSRDRDHRRKKRKGKRKHASERKISRLSKAVRDLRDQLTKKSEVPVSTSHIDHDIHDDSISLLSHISGEFCDNGRHENNISECDNFTLNIGTKLKEPSVPKAPESFIKWLVDVQHLDSDAWNDIRYSETQKSYTFSSGFKDLDMNEEVKGFETPRHLALADKAFAALTMCVLKQQESLQMTLRDLLTWSKESKGFSFEDLNNKIYELFSSGDFHKISLDLLQLICGHRAEVIEMRRNSVVKHVKDPLVKSMLQKIPPTSTHLFKAEQFTFAMEKTGGVKKCFWPANKAKGSSASQADRSRSRVPSQGTRFNKQPSQGCQGQTNPIHGHCSNLPPPQGGYKACCSSETRHNFSRTAPNNMNSNSFRGRPSRPNTKPQAQPKGRKRNSSPSNYHKDNKRRKF